MCELKVLRKNKIVFKDVVYAKADGNRVTVKDVLGASKSFDNCIIAEVDIRSERLLLMPVKEQ